MGAQDPDVQDSAEWHHRMLRAWQLALLRFAVTRDNADRLNVMAIASEIDRGGRHDEQRHFSFFRKTSTDLCAAILGRSAPNDGKLRQFLADIDDARLKRALVSALDVDSAATAGIRKPRDGLWRGLASRGDVRPGNF
ncbi:hypothetical protein ACFFWD_25030 [Bradyrhizobium erythrophlei]|uniref:hypothetical protein n=1 Tax=Bradyrhizobium erythrophlei TaxID=1437360 RepID=UPI0035EC08C3